MAKTAAARTAGAQKETAATAVATAAAAKQKAAPKAALQATQPSAAPSAAPKAKSHYVARPQPYLEMLFKAGSFPSAQGTLLKHIFDYLKLDRVTTQHLPQLGPFVTCDAAACLYLNMLGMLVGEYNGLLKLGEYSRKLDLNAIFDYICLENPDAARKMLNSFRVGIERLSTALYLGAAHRTDEGAAEA